MKIVLIPLCIIYNLFFNATPVNALVAQGCNIKRVGHLGNESLLDEYSRSISHNLEKYIETEDGHDITQVKGVNKYQSNNNEKIDFQQNTRNESKRSMYMGVAYISLGFLYMVGNVLVRMEFSKQQETQ